jgi:hypothetical protein
VVGVPPVQQIETDGAIPFSPVWRSRHWLPLDV